MFFNTNRILFLMWLHHIAGWGSEYYSMWGAETFCIIALGKCAIDIVQWLFAEDLSLWPLDHGLLHWVCLIDTIKRVCVRSINQSLQSPDKQAKTRTHTNTLPIDSSDMSKTPKTWRLKGLGLFPASIKGLREYLLAIHAKYFHLKQHYLL